MQNVFSLFQFYKITQQQFCVIYRKTILTKIVNHILSHLTFFSISPKVSDVRYYMASDFNWDLICRRWLAENWYVTSFSRVFDYHRCDVSRQYLDEHRNGIYMTTDAQESEPVFNELVISFNDDPEYQ